MGHRKDMDCLRSNDREEMATRSRMLQLDTNRRRKWVLGLGGGVRDLWEESGIWGRSRDLGMNQGGGDESELGMDRGAGDESGSWG